MSSLDATDENEQPAIGADGEGKYSPRKMGSMVLGDGSFEALMKERSKERKEKEEKSLAQIKIQLQAAERALTTETQRRVQSTHALQLACTQKIQEMESHFERILDERSLRMEERLATVQGKMEELTLKFEEEKDRVPKEMEDRGKELVEMMESFKSELAQERTDRLSREGRILKQMDDHAQYITEAIEQESVLREDVSKELMERISENEKYRAQSEHELQMKVQREMSELRDMIEKEKRERAGMDKALSDRVNQFTTSFERTLLSLTDDM